MLDLRDITSNGSVWHSLQPPNKLSDCLRAVTIALFLGVPATQAPGADKIRRGDGFGAG